MDYIIGVDIGTSGTKAVAFDGGGDIIGSHYVGYPLLNPQSGYFEQEPEVLYAAVMESVSVVARSVIAAISGSRLLAVSFSSAMHGLIAVDGRHQPLTNCITWADTRSESFADGLKATDEGLDIYRKTGTPIHPMSPLCKLLWMRESLPGVFEAAHKFISVKEYVFFRLFGRYVIDESLASATGLFNIHTFDWHVPALELAGISCEQLSEPVPITYTLSGLDTEQAAQLHIPADTPFVVGGSDGCLANLGAQAVRAGDAVVTIGTSGAIRMSTTSPKTDKMARTFCYVLTRTRFVSGGAINSGGVVLRWYKDNFGLAHASEEEAYRLLAEEAAGVAAGAGGLVFLPYLAGERAPHWNAAAKGMFFGVQMHHRKAHFTRAVFEGIVYSLYSVGRVLEETGGPINAIHANGGFARSVWWVQLLADVFNKEVYVQQTVEGAAKGAWLVACKALGNMTDFDDYLRVSPVGAVFRPDAAAHEAYMANFGTFQRLYDSVKAMFY
ncbi:gluconokinase [Parapedobacter composti]|uniref:Gluconokinase n=1 Tax=Parapedobacter composti TaxID=623281 RepID=A0A1I1E9M2_9SPHI|nr:gluconokinase [Parapedobacter composti]SFB83839.1 gluconokinase [Parapedobacter composti]